MNTLHNLLSFNKVAKKNKKMKTKISDLENKNKFLGKKLKEFKVEFDNLKDELAEQKYLNNIHFKKSKLYQKELSNILENVISKLVIEKINKENCKEIYDILYSLDKEGQQLIGTAYNLTEVDIDKEYPQLSNSGLFYNQSRETILNYIEKAKFDNFNSKKYKNYKKHLYYSTVQNLLEFIKTRPYYILEFNDDDKNIKLFLSDIIMELLAL